MMQLLSHAYSSSTNILTSRQVTSSSGLSSSSMGTRRVSSSGGLRAACRPLIPTGRSTSSATSKPSRPSCLPSSNAPSARSSPVLKSGHTTSKSSAPSRGASPVRSRAWKPSDMPGFSLKAPPNVRTSLPERPSSACRGRPGAPIGNGHSGSSGPAVRRPHLNGGDNVSPVLIGTKMVERVVNVGTKMVKQVVNARKLARPKQDDRRSSNNSLIGTSSTSPDSVGFGRTMSLDMALRILGD